MTTEYAGRGDPKRSMELLWGDRKGATRGPKQGLSVEQIVQSAIAIVDADGLDALSMRRVAEALGVGTMSLYTYVPGKDELLDVMLDTVYAELVEPHKSATWRAGLEWHARLAWNFYHRHPWVLQLSVARAILGPHEMAAYDATLAVALDTGLSGSEIAGVVGLISSFVRGAAQNALDAALAAQRTGVSNDEWWMARAPLLEKYFDPDRFPAVKQVEALGAFEAVDDTGDYLVQHARRDFEFGLQRVLDGIESYVSSHEGLDE